jgi:hypothetical protein
MFIPLTLLHYGSRRHSVRAADPAQTAPIRRVLDTYGAHGVTRPTRPAWEPMPATIRPHALKWTAVTCNDKGLGAKTALRPRLPAACQYVRNPPVTSPLPHR